MPIYTCEKCNKTFNRKSGYVSHSSRVKPCSKDNINNECIYCNKIYSTRFNLNAHLNTCKEKPIVDEVTQSQIEEIKKMFERKFEEQEKKFEEQQKHNQELEKKIEELSHLSDHKEMKNNNITVTENSNNNNITTNNTINIYSSGKEDLSILDKEDILKLCTAGTFYPIIAAEILHCNEKYPKHICL
jgi:hypothetical protein